MDPLNALPDEDLVKLFISGEEKAFKMLFQRHKESLYHSIRFYISEANLAEDLLQDTFIKVYISLQSNKYHENGKFSSWSKRIAHNICMDYLRKPTWIVYVEDWGYKEWTHEITASHEERVIKLQMENQLVNLVNKLPDEQKKVITYRYENEMSFKEIADKMDTSINTSLGRMRYGLMHLRKMMDLV